MIVFHMYQVYFLFILHVINYLYYTTLCVLIYVHYNSEIMGRLKLDTTVVQEISNPYAPYLSVSTKPGH